MTATHPLQQVLQHLHAGRWNAAHDLGQHDGTMLGAWLHGILHPVSYTHLTLPTSDLV